MADGKVWQSIGKRTYFCKLNTNFWHWGLNEIFSLEEECNLGGREGGGRRKEGGVLTSPVK